MLAIIAMNTFEQIQLAFASRILPEKTVAWPILTSEQTDAAWFSGKNWKDLSRLDWKTHGDAFYGFLPEAFLYFLPSILTIAIESISEHSMPAENLISMLDRSPTPENWDDFFLPRVSCLSDAEYSAISSWLLELDCEGSPYDSAALARSFDTIQLLRQDAVRRRPDAAPCLLPRS